MKVLFAITQSEILTSNEYETEEEKQHEKDMLTTLANDDGEAIITFTEVEAPNHFGALLLAFSAIDAIEEERNLDQEELFWQQWYDEVIGHHH